MSEEKDKENIIFQSSDGMIEICEMPEGDLAGRKKIKMTALKINIDESTWNDNGITWIKQYVQDNLDSIIGAPYVVSWLLSKEEGIPSDHGRMTFNDDGDVQFDSDAVGSISDAYIEERIINDVNCEVLTTEGYLFSQRYNQLIDWLKEEIPNNIVFGSIEINGKGKEKNIVYANESKNSDGTSKMGRQPKIFDFSGLAILSSAVEPADKFSQVIEINSNKEGVIKDMADIKNKGVKKVPVVKNSKIIEINDVNYEDIATLVTRAFNLAMYEGSDVCCCGYSYYIHKFYPLTGRVIMRSWDNVGEYYMTTYSITNSEITIGAITEVEEDWKPVEEETEVEINTELIKNIINKKNINKEAKKNMDDKIVTELNEKLEGKAVEINNLQKELEGSKLSLVEANKLAEATKTEKASADEEINACKEELNKVKEELNACKEELNKLKSAKDVAETNTYFETEIVKNGFADTEVNSLKEFVTNGDLVGLKSAEAELCAKKFKEIIASKSKEVIEINSLSTMITTKVQTEKDIKGKKIPSFFNN